ncbi:unnamed protein product [Peniophora sp. CBMAI 1063]|nr:unnamed protein product [Peniophora sp. CBMAI 1063]
MPRTTSKPLPDYLTSGEVDGKDAWRCALPGCGSDWMSRKSIWQHIDNNKTHIARLAAAERSQTRRSGLSISQQNNDDIFDDGPALLPSAHPDAPMDVDDLDEEASADDILCRCFNLNGFDFLMETKADAKNKERAALAESFKTFALFDPAQAASSLGADGFSTAPSDRWEEEDTLTNILREHSISLDGKLDGDDIQRMAYGHQNTVSSDPGWKPYSSKLIFLLDVFDNLPRNPVSDSLLRVLLWMLEELNVDGVPSLYAFRKEQRELRDRSGVPTLRFKSVHGNYYFSNDIRAIIANDYTCRLTRQQLHFYPEIPDGPISEVWHAEKWRHDMDVSTLTPMYIADRATHYYVRELAQDKSGAFYVPVRWVMQHGEMYADAWRVEISQTSGHARILSDPRHDLAFIRADSLRRNFLALKEDGLLPQFSKKSRELEKKMPNPLRALADGDPLYSSFVDLHPDDVSGNRSKSWNKHINVYMTHRNLPRSTVHQEFHHHFVSTSQHASALEQLDAVKTMIDSTHSKPVQVRDATTGESAKFRIFAHAELADNPMQDELSCHMCGNASHNCRKCMSGGTHAEKMTDDGYHALFSPSAAESRSSFETRLEVLRQLNLACTGVSDHVERRQTMTGVNDSYAQPWIDKLIERARALRAGKVEGKPKMTIAQASAELWNSVVLPNQDKIFNPNLRMIGLNIHQDTPVEILHSILLGIIKYIWRHSLSLWNDKIKATFVLRLQSTDILGLSVPPIRAGYLTQYGRSLVGRQLKTVGQTVVFHIHDIVDKEVFDVWKAVGELTALLWLPEIDDMKEYTHDLEIAVANVIDAFCIIDPGKIIWKIKLHLITHSPDDARRFGPLVGLSTEVSECFNAVFRACSIYSNHHAPSRDIALQLAAQEGLKHRLIGGWWLAEDGETWVQSGSGIRGFFEKHPQLQLHMGWSVAKPPVPGTARLAPVQERQPRSWSATLAATTINAADYASQSAGEWTACTSFIAASGDTCRKASWVAADSPTEPGKTIFGRVIEIIVSTESANVLCVLDVFQQSKDRHPMYSMPVLRRPLGEEHRVVLKPTSIHFDFNTQHDCLAAKCSATGERRTTQERIQTDNIEVFIVHAALDVYIVNLHALHNAHRLRRVFDRQLTAPIASSLTAEARRKLHDSLAEKLRGSAAASKAAREAEKEASALNTQGQSLPKRKRIDSPTGEHGASEFVTGDREESGEEVAARVSRSSGLTPSMGTIKLPSRASLQQREAAAAGGA